MAKNDDDNELSSIPTTRFARTKKLTGLTAKVGLSTLAGKMSRAFMSDENAITSRLASQLKNTQQIVQTLSEMKGAAMKLGQMLSLHGEHLFPKEVTQILSTLQSESKFISFAEIHKILLQELGPDYNTRLLDLSKTPIAAASIGQVHKACTTDGTWVAVKVQYPGVEQSIDSDVDTLSSLLKLVSQIPNAEDFSPVVEEIKNVLKAETNYITEADNLEFFSDYFLKQNKEPNLIFPKVFKDLSTRQVLTTELIKGQTVQEFTKDDSVTSATRTQIGTAFLRVFYHELFRLGALQTDPNFGNYLIAPQKNALVCLDFGAVRHYSPEWIDHYIQMVKCTYTGNKKELLEHTYVLGLLNPDDTDEVKELHIQLCNMFIEPFKATGPYDFKASDLPQRMRAMIPKVFSTFKFRAPPQEIVFLNRKMVGTYLFMSTIGAKVEVRPLLEEFLGI